MIVSDKPARSRIAVAKHRPLGSTWRTVCVRSLPFASRLTEVSVLSVLDHRGRSRRGMLRIGSLGLGGLCLPQLLGTRALAAGGNKPIATGKSVIFLYQFGGPSQFETFDPKMNAPEEI